MKLTLSLTPLAAAALIAAAPAAQAALTVYQAPLSPEAAGATGSGVVQLVYDSATHWLSVGASFSGLSGVTTVAHIHCCTADAGTGTVGVAVTPGTLPGFPAGVGAGSYFTILDLTQLSTYTANFVANFGGGTVAGAEAALIDGIEAGKAYFNVHSTTYPAGEIRGFPALIPEPGTYALLALGLAGVAFVTRRRRD